MPRLLPLLLLLTASLAALLATNAHSSYPGPLAHTVHSTNMFVATFAPLYGLASPLTRTRRLAHLLPRTELARLLALVFPSRSGRSGAGNRSAGDPQASGAAHWLRTLQRSAPETRLASRSALSKGWPPTPLGRSSTLEQRRTTGPGVVATRSGKQLNLEGQCRWRRADYYTGRPKAESPLSQGPRPVL